ncbi:hypothetical protein G2W53_008272 [Senna tora]|uniref:Uncharacterized protein n=1 Tax=Senna tora TaxID=362788 RepID=A0A835CGU1_9FABA|nr:hypothetical protein G2W53_008272 [Senna tora]
MDSLGQVLGKESLGRVRGLGFGPSPTQVFGHAATRLGRIPLNGGSDHAGDVALYRMQIVQNHHQRDTNPHRPETVFHSRDWIILVLNISP